MYGLMSLTWGWAENSLVMTIGIANKYAGPIKGHPDPPLSLKKRLDCLKVALRDIPALTPVQADGRALIARFKELAPRRNTLIHSSTTPEPGGGFSGVGFAVKGGDYVTEDHRFDVPTTWQLAADIAIHSDNVTAFMYRVAKIFDPAQAETNQHFG